MHDDSKPLPGGAPRRRDVLRLALGATALLLVEACGPSPSSGGPVPTTGAPGPVNAAPPTAKPAAQPTSAPAAAPTQAAAAQPTPAVTAQAQGQRGGTLRVGLDVDADTLDPRLTKNTSGYRVKELAFNGLVAINPDYSPVPDLAQVPVRAVPLLHGPGHRAAGIRRQVRFRQQTRWHRPVQS
jgi:hypothetical protein